MIKNCFRKYKSYRITNAKRKAISDYIKNGRMPWTAGYSFYKEDYIHDSILDNAVLDKFISKKMDENFGLSLDERAVEYPWIFSKLNNEHEKILDAGSTFNYEYILNHPKIQSKDLTILTYNPEPVSFNQKRISYVYADLRDIPIKDNYFDVVISQSTIEHIDMDNSIYGYSNAKPKENLTQKSFEYMKAVNELIRVVKPTGTLLITVPFGKFENHVFFQQFDSDMLGHITGLLNGLGRYTLDFIKYTKGGWVFSDEEDCKDIISYNPHTGMGKGDDNAAHCRAVCCITFIKNQI